MPAPITIDQVCALAPETWLNDGFTAVVRSIEQKKSGPQTRTPNKPFWVCVLASATGPDTAEMTVFTAPRFNEGDVIDVTGKGIKRVDGYQGGSKVSIGRESIITVVGRSAHHSDQTSRAAAGQPAANGQPQHVPGQTVGMALKEAISLVVGVEDAPHPFKESEAFWRQVHETASDVIRVSKMLETGQLAPSARDRRNPPQQGRASAPARPAAPAPQENLDEDVPF